MRELTLRLIGILGYSLAFFIMASNGLTITTWQFWGITLGFCLADFTYLLRKGFFKKN